MFRLFTIAIVILLGVGGVFAWQYLGVEDSNERPREESERDVSPEVKTSIPLQETSQWTTQELNECLQDKAEQEPATSVKLDGKNVSRPAGLSCYIEREQTFCITRGGDVQHCYYKQAVRYQDFSLCSRAENLEQECNNVLARFNERMTGCESQVDTTKKNEFFSQLRTDRAEKIMEILGRTPYK
ncbi:MAG: hypothetical protein Q8P55_01840 [bacterium]|nr:hypothetical protein [bacterium]